MLKPNKETPLGNIARLVCAIITFESGPQYTDTLCSSQATYVVKGLLGINPQIRVWKFSKAEEEQLNLQDSHFVTFELDMTGKQSLSMEEEKQIEQPTTPIESDEDKYQNHSSILSKRLNSTSFDDL